MSLRDSGDDDNPRRPLEDSAAVSVGETAAPLTKGLPWQFWLWQCMPMVFLILWMPPGEKPEWWIHTWVINWFEQQPWSELIPFFVFNTWFCQGILLAYWMVWGNGLGEWFLGIPHFQSAWTWRACGVIACDLVSSSS